MNDVDRAIARVQEAIRGGYPAAWLAERAGLSKRAVQYASAEAWNPRARNLSALIDALDAIEREAEMAQRIKPAPFKAEPLPA